MNNALIVLIIRKMNNENFMFPTYYGSSSFVGFHLGTTEGDCLVPVMDKNLAFLFLDIKEH